MVFHVETSGAKKAKALLAGKGASLLCLRSGHQEEQVLRGWHIFECQQWWQDHKAQNSTRKSPTARHGI
ncbi:hypothetical protein GB927_007875 [Shinella sp. CPCC 100929]|uniref:Uncharacterized protein n=1 Tax=Shinella lacus TaxID=2654216 RepID=A0ABT1R457_9HYPH|nr:hypothetical protein [Shinella lacus]